MVAAETSDPFGRFLEELEGDLKGLDDPRRRFVRAFAEDEFTLYCQLISPLAEGSLPAYEILVRLKEEDEKLLPPGTFLPTLDQHGMMPVLDRWVLDRFLAWHASHPVEAAFFTLNLAPATIEDEQFADFAADRIRQHPGAPPRLCFEMTESDIVARRTFACALAERLHAARCLVAIASFGRGILRPKVVRVLAPDVFKIDGDIVRRLAHGPAAARRLATIVRLARALKLATIAEQVESTEALPTLRAAGVGYAQGFALSYPVPLAEIG